MKDWRESRLDDVEQRVREVFPCVQVFRSRDPWSAGLAAYWLETGNGSSVSIPHDAEPEQMHSANEIVAHVVARLWECAPIVGRA